MQEYTKSPLNYVGGKYKLLSQIIPIFPANIDTFVDLFGGGFNVGINVNAANIIYNDICMQVVELLDYLSKTDIEDLISKIEEYINTYGLSKTNQDGFNQLRADYNANSEPIKFYTLLCYAFNYQIRFNLKGEYNMPFGRNKSSFNPELRKKFIIFVRKLHSCNCKFYNKSFETFDFTDLGNNDFVYCDPPYLGSVATYNEKNGWTEEREQVLLDLLDTLNDKCVRWALSNNLKYDNKLLENWREKYNMHYLNGNYSNCNYHKLDRSKDIEVLITNY